MQFYKDLSGFCGHKTFQITQWPRKCPVCRSLEAIVINQGGGAAGSVVGGTLSPSFAFTPFNLCASARWLLFDASPDETFGAPKHY
jgi:hypothetical protein